MAWACSVHGYGGSSPIGIHGRRDPVRGEASLPSPLLPLVPSAALGYWWQEQLRDLMGMRSQAPASLVLLPITAAVIFILVLAAGEDFGACTGGLPDGSNSGLERGPLERLA